jgi:hypothetical protein
MTGRIEKPRSAKEMESAIMFTAAARAWNYELTEMVEKVCADGGLATEFKRESDAIMTISKSIWALMSVRHLADMLDEERRLMAAVEEFMRATNALMEKARRRPPGLLNLRQRRKQAAIAGLLERVISQRVTFLKDVLETRGLVTPNGEPDC